MSTIITNNITKRFGNTLAVDQLSFDVRPGEIFGLLGPNGAGKTTSIRMILDIFKPDSGEISVLGGPMTDEKKNRIGYLPEERGLYQDIPLQRCLTFLATLKGMPEKSVGPKLTEYLKKFDLYEAREKKVKELSKGMQQKSQLIATLLHEPELLIIDEPFSALDPVNTEMVKEILVQQRNQGKAIIMSTHQMNQVEELCDRILLINHGHQVLYGTLEEIQDQFASRDILVTPRSSLPSAINGVTEIHEMNGRYLLALEDDIEPHQVLSDLVKNGTEMTAFEVAVPPLNQIFIQVVKKQARDEDA